MPSLRQIFGGPKGLTALALFLVVCMILSLNIGRFQFTFSEMGDFFRTWITSGRDAADLTMGDVLLDIRIPRVIAAILVGGALSVSGASYQTLFKNPLVSPSILGVSSGAAFGAALAMVMEGSWWEIQLFALIFGLIAVTFSTAISYIFGRKELTVLILGGVVVSSLFGSMLSILKLAADTENVLPTIVFWLMGSLARSSFRDIAVAIPALGISFVLLWLFRYQINALAAGEDEASSMGVNVPVTKLCVITAATLMTAVSVSICGIVGWVGMVVPHIARLTVGASFARLSIFSFLFGGLFLLGIDDLIRANPDWDLPLGIMTSLVGTPIFVFFLSRVKKGWT
ncbi:MAG: iron ABC transporter permease [Burkholderiales bacterium]|nr:iron ABC transporter permease [Burkholderiales bacterium]